ncbi:MAG TPA: hypothetical protein VFQ39_07260, partial [Longimicrobium sp.]|nr:hypothetical protein [Longimicrobium sp.]
MLPRLRRIASAAALAALLVTWTTGVWAACMRGPETTVPASAHAHAMHGGHGAMRHAAHHAPAPQPGRPRHDPPRHDAQPPCPMMVTTGGSCTGPLAGAPSPAAEPVAAAPAMYAPADGVRELIIPILF